MKLRAPGRLSLLGALIAQGALTISCASLDRESYSLVIRKKVHRYQKLTPVEEELLEAVKTRTSLESSDGPPKREPLAREGVYDLEPFRPFAYCLHHESLHGLESVIALGAAPVEYPVGITLKLGADVVRALIEGVKDPQKLILEPKYWKKKETVPIPGKKGKPGNEDERGPPKK